MAMMLFSICIPVRDDVEHLRQCLAGFGRQNLSDCEILVCDDGSTPSLEVDQLADIGVRFDLVRQAPLGPSAARNLLAQIAAGRYLFFVDADTVATPETLDRLRRILTTHPELDAFYGSYDDEPADPGLVSSYKNLLHHYTHQHSAEQHELVTTFWCGCGVIRRDLYREIGGLSLFYDKPSIEDIELGSRLSARGVRICIFPELQVKHLKRWTLQNWLYTDLVRRGIPWVRLMRSRKRWGNQLNFSWPQRIASASAVVAVACIALIAWNPLFGAGAIVAFTAFLIPNLGFFRLVRRKRGLATAILIVPLHLTYAVVCVAAFGAALAAPPLTLPTPQMLRPLEPPAKSKASLVQS
jgi:glycosyltransferase involved in cell wall biosynthesis